MMSQEEETLQVQDASLNSDYRHLIIETPELQTVKHRFSSSLVTMVFWIFWLYLWQPVVSIIAWAFGFKFFYDNMISLGGIGGFVKLVGIYVLVVFLIAFIFFGWAYYNNRRFKNKKRRGKIWKISFLNLGERYDLTEDQVLNCKSSRRLVVHFDQSGKITCLTNGIRHK
jgi:biofilm PGA synthesis protein PgaD